MFVWGVHPNLCYLVFVLLTFIYFCDEGILYLWFPDFFFLNNYKVSYIWYVNCFMFVSDNMLHFRTTLNQMFKKWISCPRAPQWARVSINPCVLETVVQFLAEADTSQDFYKGILWSIVLTLLRWMCDGKGGWASLPYANHFFGLG